MTCRSIQPFCEAHRAPGLGALGTYLLVIQIDICDGRVYLQRLGQGLEAATDQGWHVVQGFYHQNLITEILRTIDIQLRHVESLWFKTWKNDPEIHGFIQHLHTVWHTAGLGVFDNSTRSEMNDETTAPPNQTSHCQRMSKTWHHDMPQHSAIQRSPPHTRPWRPRHQSGSITNRCPWRTSLSSAPRPRPGGSNRSRLARCSRVLPSKPDHWNPANNWHSTETCRISLIQNLEKRPRNPRFHSASTYSMTYSWIGSIWQLNSIRDERWNYSTSKPNFSLSKDVENMTSWHAAAFSRAHHRPGLGPLVAHLVAWQTNLRDGPVYLQCLGQGLEAATD